VSRFEVPWQHHDPEDSIEESEKLYQVEFQETAGGYFGVQIRRKSTNKVLYVDCMNFTPSVLGFKNFQNLFEMRQLLVLRFSPNEPLNSQNQINYIRKLLVIAT